MTTVDLTPLLQAAVGVTALSLGVFGSLALKAVAARFGLQVSQAQADEFDLALEKSIQAGGMMAEQSAAVKGWEHPDVRNQILSGALSTLIEHFPAALQKAGLDPDVDADKIRAELTAAFPMAMASVIHSPATTNGPATPVAAPSAAA